METESDFDVTRVTQLSKKVIYDLEDVWTNSVKTTESTEVFKQIVEKVLLLSDSATDRKLASLVAELARKLVKAIFKRKNLSKEENKATSVILIIETLPSLLSAPRRYSAFGAGVAINFVHTLLNTTHTNTLSGYSDESKKTIVNWFLQTLDCHKEHSISAASF